MGMDIETQGPRAISVEILKAFGQKMYVLKPEHIFYDKLNIIICNRKRNR